MPIPQNQRWFIFVLSLAAAARVSAQDADEPLPKGAIARLGTTRLVHLGGLQSVAVSPDGQIVASGVQEGKTIYLGHGPPYSDSRQENSIRLWDSATGKVIREITAPDAPVSALCFDPTSKILYAGCGRYFCAFNVATGRMIWQQEPIKSDAFYPKVTIHQIVLRGEQITTVHRGNLKCEHHQILIRFQDVRTGAPLPHPACLESSVTKSSLIPTLFENVVVSKDGRIAAIVSCSAERIETPKEGPYERWKFSDRTLKIADLVQGTVVYSIPVGTVQSLKMSSDSQTLAFLENGTQLCTINTATSAKKLIGESRSTWWPSLAFIPGNRLALRLYDGEIHVWNLATGKSVTPDEVAKVHFQGSASGGNLTAGICDNTVSIFETDTGRPIRLAEGHRRTPLIRYAISTKNALLSRDDDGALLWDLRSRTISRRINTKGIRIDATLYRDWGQTFHQMDAGVVLERGLYVGGTEKGAELLYAQAGQPACQLEGTTGDFSGWRNYFHFSANGSRVLYRSGNGYGFFNVANGKRLSTIEGRWSRFKGYNSPERISNTGKYFCSGADHDALKLFDVDSGKLLHRLAPSVQAPDERGHSVLGFHFSADDSHILGESHEAIRKERGGERVDISVWDIATGKLTRQFTYLPRVYVFFRQYLNDPQIHTLALSPDKRSIAVVGRNSATVEIWELASGTKRGEFIGHSGRVAEVAFSPDGKELASSSEDTTILLWDLTRPFQPAKLNNRVEGEELATHFKTLFERDAAKADASIWRLIHAAEDSVPYLTRHLRPAVAPDSKHVNNLLRDVGSDNFRTRSKAQEALERFGELVLPDIETALKWDNPLEGKRRLEDLLAKAGRASDPFGNNERIGQWRVLEVLEKIGTPAAIEHLRALGNGAPSAQLTLAALSVVARIDASKRPPAP